MKTSGLFLIGVVVVQACVTGSRTSSQPRYSHSIVSIPQIFADGIISTRENSDFDLCFAPDGRTVYFTRRIGNQPQKIWQSKYDHNTWSAPVIAPFSTDRDETPFLAPDGKTLYFGSARPIEGRPGKGGFDMNIWMVEQVSGSWGKPVALGESINAVQQEKEQWPSSNENFIFSRDNREFIFCTMMRGDSTIAAYSTFRNGSAFTKPERITGLFDSEKYWRYSAILSPDGNYLLFNAFGAAGGVGKEDIFVSRKNGSGWTRARSIGPLVNTRADEGSPRFSPDGKYFFFSRSNQEQADEDGIWSIYFVETSYLKLADLFK